MDRRGMIMRHNRYRSSACCSDLNPSILPSRPDSSAIIRSRGAQRSRHPFALTWSSECSASRWPMTRVIAIVAFFAFRLQRRLASKQQRSHTIHVRPNQPTGLRNLSRKPPIALPCGRDGFVLSSKLKAEVTSMRSRPEVRWA